MNPGPPVSNERARELIGDETADPEKRMLAQHVIDLRSAIALHEDVEARERERQEKKPVDLDVVLGHLKDAPDELPQVEMSESLIAQLTSEDCDHARSTTTSPMATCTGDAIDVDGYVDEARGVEYIGVARKQPNGKWLCLANVGGALCRVEASITFAGAALAQ